MATPAPAKDPRRAKFAKLQKLPAKGLKDWGTPLTLPKPRNAPSCTCMQLTMSSKGDYKPQQCALHVALISIPQISMPRTLTSTCISNKIQSLKESEQRQTHSTGALRELLPVNRSKTVAKMPVLEMNGMINEYADMLNNQHGDELSNADKAEVLTRLSTLLLAVSRNEEARQAAEIAIGLRPSFGAAYYIAGQSYFNTKQYDKAVNSFRAGLQEEPGRIELKEAFQKSLLELNVARRRNTDRIVRPRLNRSKSTTTRDDLGKPAWLTLKVPLPSSKSVDVEEAGEEEQQQENEADV
jgi:tetratricopeptide (TPR) repeat protein